MLSSRHSPGISTGPTEKTAQDVAMAFSEHPSPLIAELGQRALKAQAVHSNATFLFPRIHREDYEHIQRIVYECPDDLVNPLVNRTVMDAIVSMVCAPDMASWDDQKGRSHFHSSC